MSAQDHQDEVVSEIVRRSKSMEEALTNQLRAELVEDGMSWKDAQRYSVSFELRPNVEATDAEH